MGTYDDDEMPIPLPYSGSGQGNAAEKKVTIRSFHKERVGLERSELKVLLELKGADTAGEDRGGVDLVTLLDVSGSMRRDNRLDDMKLAMAFLIRKLSPIDRLSVITFSNNANRLMPLCLMTEDAKNKFEDRVKGLMAQGSTSMASGLSMALKVLEDRRCKDGRKPAIILMSDGDPTDGEDYTKIEVGNIPVYTFAIGTDSRTQVLKDMAKNGGTYSITNIVSTESSSLARAVAKCLGGLLNVAVDDLTVTVKPIEGRGTGNKPITIKCLSAGSYAQRSAPDGSLKVDLFDLYKQEKRSLFVELDLPATPGAAVTQLLQVTCSYSDCRAQSGSTSAEITVTRTEDIKDAREKDEVIIERKRLKVVENIASAIVLADNRLLDLARDELESALAFIDDGVGERNELVSELVDELYLLIDSMRDESSYFEVGRAFLNAAMVAHDLQRAATIGLPERLQMYATETMKQYLQELNRYEEYIAEVKIDNETADVSKVPTSSLRVVVSPQPPLPPLSGYSETASSSPLASNQPAEPEPRKPISQPVGEIATSSREAIVARGLQPAATIGHPERLRTYATETMKQNLQELNSYEEYIAEVKIDSKTADASKVPTSSLPVVVGPQPPLLWPSGYSKTASFSPFASNELAEPEPLSHKLSSQPVREIPPLPREIVFPTELVPVLPTSSKEIATPADDRLPAGPSPPVKLDLSAIAPQLSKRLEDAIQSLNIIQEAVQSLSSTQEYLKALNDILKNATN